LMTSGLGLYLGHLGSETWSLDQIIEKPCVDNRSHSFHLILMKYGQNVYLDNISILDRIWVIWGQKLGHRANSSKTLCR